MSSPTERISLVLQPLAAEIRSTLRHEAGEETPFLLVVQSGDVVQYVSNADRSEGIEVLRGLLERWEAGRADIPAHYNPDLTS